MARMLFLSKEVMGRAILRVAEYDTKQGGTNNINLTYAIEEAVNLDAANPAL